MPAKSAKQYGLMQASAHGIARGIGGPSKEVAQHFIEMTPREKRKKFVRALSKKSRE